MKRVLSVWIPGWAVQRVARRGRASSGPRPEALLVFREAGGQRVVMHGCAAAHRCGVRPGMTLAHARALVSPRAVHVAEHDPQGEAAGLLALARWAWRWSPIVEPDPPDGLLLDISGCQHLFGGEARLLGSLRGGLRRLGLSSRLCIASTIGAAWAVARGGARAASIIEPGEERAALAELPLGLLRLDPEAVESLMEVGVETVRELLSLPRSSLPARFGASVLTRLDQALGLLPQTVWRLEQTPPVETTVELQGATTRLESVEAATRQALNDLCAQLGALESGLRTLVLALDRLGADPVVVRVEFARPSRSLPHVWAMLRPKLERLNMGFGVERVTMTARRVARLPHRQRSMPCMMDAQHESDSAGAELLDTIAARTGRDSLRRIELVESHVPERACRSVPALSRGQELSGALDGWSVPRPSLLIEPPEPVAVVAPSPEGPVERFTWRGRERRVLTCEGPERIGPEWWKGHAGERDYFRLQDGSGLWSWLYRQNSGGQWFIHGVWA